MTIELRSFVDLNLVKPNRFYLDKNLPSDHAFRTGKAMVEPLVSKYIRVLEGSRVTVTWQVSPNPAYGLPRDLSRRIEGAVMHLASMQQPKPVTNPIRCGSLTDFALVMGLKPTGKGGISGNVQRRLEKAIKTLAVTPNEVSIFALYDHGKRKSNTKETVFNVLSGYYFEGENYRDGTVATELLVDLHPLILSNINAGYVRPIDWSYNRRLSAYGSRVYEYVGPMVYAHIARWVGRGKRGAIEPVDIRYSELCAALAITRQPHLSNAMRKCVAFNELVETKYLERIDWEPIPGVRDDWKLVMHVGSRALAEHRRFSAEEAAQLPLLEAESRPAEAPVVVVAPPAPDNTAEVLALVRDFYAARYGACVDPKRLALADVRCVEGLLRDGYEPEFIRYLWAYACEEGRKGRKQVDRPGGAVSLYLPAAEALYARRRAASEAPRGEESAQPVVALDPEAINRRFREEQTAGAFAEDTRRLLEALRAREPSTHTFNEQYRWTYVLARDERSVTLAVRDACWRDFFTNNGAAQAAFGGAVAEALGAGLGVRFEVSVP